MLISSDSTPEKALAELQRIIAMRDLKRKKTPTPLKYVPISPEVTAELIRVKNVQNERQFAKWKRTVHLEEEDELSESEKAVRTHYEYQEAVNFYRNKSKALVKVEHIVESPPFDPLWEPFHIFPWSSIMLDAEELADCREPKALR